MADVESIREFVISGRHLECADLVREAIDEGIDVGIILNDGLISAMTEVGRRFREGEFFVPEVLIAARAMNAAMEIVKPLLIESGVEPAATLLIGTVKDDIHDIGKNLVGMMLKGAGFEVIDLGHDVSPSGFVDAVKEKKPDALLMSSLLTTTMPNMKHTVDAIVDAGVRDSVIIMVGGAPLSDRYANEIGADGFAPDAATAVDVLKQLLSN